MSCCSAQHDQHCQVNAAESLLKQQYVYPYGAICVSSAVEQPYHTAVQMGNMQVQQVAGQSDHEGAQLTLSAATIFDVVQQAPRLLEILTSECVKALTATCAKLRQNFRSSVTTVQMTNGQDTAMLCADKWPNLVIVAISTTMALDDDLYGDRLESCLSDKGWSIIVRLQLQQAPDDLMNWFSAGQQQAVLIVNASHHSSLDMDTKAHASVLARFATKWEAKTQSIGMYLESKSVHIDPLKHLHMGKWPCLKLMTYSGKYGNALPISCFFGESSLNIQFASSSHCSLDAEAVQSLVTTCPHLHDLRLTTCKVASAALTCLNQACFPSLTYLDLSKNPLGSLGVQSLRSCHLPALQKLTLDGTSVSALAAIHLAQGCWPKLELLHLFDNQLNVEAIAYLVKGEWPMLQELGVSWTCVPEAAFAVLGVDDACKQFENKTSRSRLHYTPVSLLRSSFLFWPKLEASNVRDAITSSLFQQYM